MKPLKDIFKTKKHTYKFNPHTLTYEKVAVGIKDKLKGISFTVAFGLVLGVVFMIIGYQFIDSPKEKAMKKEIRQYKRQLANLNKKMDRVSAVLEDIENRDDNVYRTIFEVEPISSEVRKSGIGGPDRYKEMEGFNCSQSIIETTKKIDTLTKRLYIQSVSLDEVYEMAKNKADRIASMPAIMPIPKNQCKLVSGFGVRYHPILKYRRMHTGIDLTARKGTPVYATGDGTVSVAGKSLQGYSGYGVICVINHGYGFQTLYAHLLSLNVKPGQKVKRGEQIGSVGTSGLSQGYHLHYEVHQNGKKVNPIFFFFNDLTADEYEQVIEAADQENQCLS